MELIKELGRRIQKARKEKGLTQQELADLSHVSLKHVQGCERGVKNPSFEVLRAFCKVLNLSLDSLMNLDLPEDPAGVGLRSFGVNACGNKLLSEKAMALVDFFGNCPAYIGQVQEIVAVHREKAAVSQGSHCMAHAGF